MLSTFQPSVATNDIDGHKTKAVECVGNGNLSFDMSPFATQSEAACGAWDLWLEMAAHATHYIVYSGLTDQGATDVGQQGWVLELESSWSALGW